MNKCERNALIFCIVCIVIILVFIITPRGYIGAGPVIPGVIYTEISDGFYVGDHAVGIMVYNKELGEIPTNISFSKDLMYNSNNYLCIESSHEEAWRVIEVKGNCSITTFANEDTILSGEPGSYFFLRYMKYENGKYSPTGNFIQVRIIEWKKSEATYENK